MGQERVLITGGTGSLGKALTTRLIQDPALKEIRIFSRGANAQVGMRKDLTDPRIAFIVGDVRDKDALRAAMRRVDVVYHLAALKDVQVCEDNSREAILTNITGSQNVIDVAISAGCTTVIFASSDKAAAPFSLYGITKACAEKIVTSACRGRDTGQRVICVRCGNVLGSSVSVIPQFREQIEKYNSIAVTDLEMTRFVMTMEDAVSLMLFAQEYAWDGEIVVKNMSAVTLADVVTATIRVFGNDATRIHTIGSRRGDKIHEVLMSEEEEKYARDLGNGYFIITPQVTHCKEQDRYALYPCVRSEQCSSRTAFHLPVTRIEQLVNAVCGRAALTTAINGMEGVLNVGASKTRGGRDGRCT